MKKIGLMFTVAAVLVPVAAHGNTITSCPDTSLADVLGSTCTIGDKTFTFASSLVSVPGSQPFALLDASGIGFTTDATNSESPGFTLDVDLQVGPSSQLSEADFALEYSVSITDLHSGALIIGTTLTATGLSATGGLANVLAVNLLSQSCQPSNPLCPSVAAFAEAKGDGLLIPSSTVPLGAGTVSAFGEAAIDLGAANVTGSPPSITTLTSAKIQFNEILTPEPSSLLLLGAGMFNVVANLRRKLFD
jgi:hypothetical protein